MSLLICNALGFSFLTIWNEWQNAHAIRNSNLIEVLDDKLVLKVPISIPYQTEWKDKVAIVRTAIFGGEFYQSTEQAYQNDTLYTFYERQIVSRENLLSVMKELSENLDDYASNQRNPLKKTSDFFKNLSKDYIEIHSKSVIFFCIEELGFKNFSYSSEYTQPALYQNFPPPIS